MRISRWIIAAAVAALAATLVAGAAFGGSKAPAAQKAVYKAGLVGDVGTFNDNGFNKNQVLGLKAAAKAIHGKAYTYDSHSSSDYQPNYQQAVHDGNKLIIAAGFLLERHGEAVRDAVPEDQVRDHRRHRGERRRTPERGGHHLRRSGERLPRRGARGQTGQEHGHEEDRRGGRDQDPVGRLVDRRLPVLREEGRQGHEDAHPVLEQLHGPGRLLEPGAERDRLRRPGDLPGRRPLR